MDIFGSNNSALYRSTRAPWSLSDTLDNSYTRSPPPRSPFACHVYTTFLHTRNAFLKIVAKKKRKEKKKKNRVFLPCSHVLSVSFPALYRLLRFTAATSHDRCLLCIVDVHVPIQEHVYNNTPVCGRNREEGIRRSCLRLRVGSFVHSTKSRDFMLLSLFNNIILEENISRMWKKEKKVFVR